MLRLRANDGQVIVPLVTIDNLTHSWRFEDVMVRPHSMQNDVRSIVSPEYAHWFWICLGPEQA